MATTFHLHYTKAGLLIDVVRSWPTQVVTNDGEPYGSLLDAVQAVVDHPAPNVAIGCPSPGEDGTCPGHPAEASWRAGRAKRPAGGGR